MCSNLTIEMCVCLTFLKYCRRKMKAFDLLETKVDIVAVKFKVKDADYLLIK